MINLKDIHPLSDFQRNAKTHIKRLKKTGKPAVLTVNGRASVVVVDVDSYELMLSEMVRQREITAIQQSMLEIERGEGIPIEEVSRRFEKKFAERQSKNVPRRKAS